MIIEFRQHVLCFCFIAEGKKQIKKLGWFPFEFLSYLLIFNNIVNFLKNVFVHSFI